MRRTLLVAGSVFLAVVLAFAALLGYRAYLQHRNATELAIRTPNGIDEAMYVRIGGIDQWIQIRGSDRRNPILLCVNGGPGASWMPLTTWFTPWEKEFTVVQWDQRGEGKSLERSGAEIASTMSVDRMSKDGIELVEFLRKHLHKNKVLLLGHSWGSILGVRMVQQHPEYFSGYVGTGQVANLHTTLTASYQDALRKAQAAHDDRTVAQLKSIGAPPYDLAHIQRAIPLFNALAAYGPASDRAAMKALIPTMITAPNYSFRDISYRNLGFTVVPPPALYEEMLSENLTGFTRFKVPVTIVQGSDDNVTLTTETKKYFESIQAPAKHFVVLDGAGHFAVWSMPEKFLPALEKASS